MSILENKPILKFVLLFSVIYSGLLISNEIPIVRKAHHSMFASVGGWVFSIWHPQTSAEISTDVTGAGANPNNDYVLTAYDKAKNRAVRMHNRSNRGTPQQYQPKAYMSFKARMSHAIATFFLLSLIWATPNSWKRKVIGSIIGLLILYILVAMKLTFLLEMADGSHTSSDGVWYWISSIVGNNESYQELFYILILAIWMLVALSKKSINTLIS